MDIIFINRTVPHKNSIQDTFMKCLNNSVNRNLFKTLEKHKKIKVPLLRYKLND